MKVWVLISETRSSPSDHSSCVHSVYASEALLDKAMEVLERAEEERKAKGYTHYSVYYDADEYEIMP